MIKISNIEENKKKEIGRPKIMKGKNTGNLYIMGLTSMIQLTGPDKGLTVSISESMCDDFDGKITLSNE